MKQRCPGCHILPSACFCAELTPIRARTQFLLVRHSREINKASNTGGIAAQVLGSRVIDYGLLGQPLDLTDLIDDDAMLLGPGGDVYADNPPKTLIVLDGTWRQVRSMRARIPPLARLRTFTPPPPDANRQRMRNQHLPEGMATIEAMAQSLAALGEPDPAETLHRIFGIMTERHLALRAYAGRQRTGADDVDVDLLVDAGLFGDSSRS